MVVVIVVLMALVYFPLSVIVASIYGRRVGTVSRPKKGELITTMSNTILTISCKHHFGPMAPTMSIKILTIMSKQPLTTTFQVELRPPLMAASGSWGGMQQLADKNQTV